MCKEARVLLIISALFTFAIGLSNIFVNVFFWKQTNEYTVIAVYHLTHYVTIPVAFVLGGMLAKRKNGIWSLRIGLLTYALFFVMILLLGGKGTAYIYMMGIIYGMATGFYWLAFNTLSFDFTHMNNRDTYNGFNGCCAGIAAAVSPMVSAYIISSFSGTKGYNVVFAMTLAIFVILTLISLFLRCKSYGYRLDFKRAFSRNCEEWSILRTSAALWGFRDVIIVFLINILTIEATGSELSLGKLTLISSMVSSASYVLVQKVIKPPQRRLSILIGALGSFAAVLGLSFKVGYGTLVLYIMMDAFFLPFFLIQLNSATFNVIDRNHEEVMRIEYMINKDLALNGGRLISVSILIVLLTLFKTSATLSFYLLFLGFVPIASAYTLGKLRGIFEGRVFKIFSGRKRIIR
ncbi:MAG TPA: MFS transporter [Clostridia bacterium]|nr:MFS transporter [Clostridia bacterium]